MDDSAGAVRDAAANGRWLLSRLDRQCEETLTQLLIATVDLVGIATGDAVALWTLSADRLSLTPIAVFHPDPDQAAATAAVIHDPSQPTGTGLWRPIIRSRRPHRWRIAPGAIPPDASPNQAEILGRLPIRAILGVPLFAGGRLVGGISLVRYGVEQGFTDESEALLVDAGRRIALVVGLLDRIRTGSHVTDRGSIAFDRAVARERGAVAWHEGAARRHEWIAGQLEQSALHDRGGDADHALDVAATARDRAERARSRAETVRQRLRGEGIEPSS